MRDIQVSVSFDMRSPDWATPTGEMYKSALEMAAFADRIGVDRIGLMEHHGSEDGYLPRPFMLASGMAAVTSRIKFSLAAVLLPLHDPVAVAEELAILDLISNGRAKVVFGAGYVPSEFAMFGKSVRDRAKLMDAGLDIILRALKGERFVAEDGRPVFIRPLPISVPEDIIMVGGAVPASARRAARFDVGFGPMTDVVDIYLEECRKYGREPREYWRPKPGMPMAIHLCEDPEQGWAALARHAVHVITEYAKWAEQEGDGSNSPFRGLTDPAVLRHAGLFAAWTPEQLLARIPEIEDRQSIGLQPLLGGLSPEEGWQSLTLLERTMPEIRAVIARLD